LAIMHTICLLIRVKLYLNSAKQSELYPVFQKLLVFILCHHTILDKLACPTDYSVCLACLKEESDSAAWNFKAPLLIIGHFPKLQYCLWMIFFTHCFSIAQDGPKSQIPSLFYHQYYLLNSLSPTPILI